MEFRRQRVHVLPRPRQGRPSVRHGRCVVRTPGELRQEHAQSAHVAQRGQHHLGQGSYRRKVEASTHGLYGHGGGAVAGGGGAGEESVRGRERLLLPGERRHGDGVQGLGALFHGCAAGQPGAAQLGGHGPGRHQQRPHLDPRVYAPHPRGGVWGRVLPQEFQELVERRLDLHCVRLSAHVPHVRRFSDAQRAEPENGRCSAVRCGRVGEVRSVPGARARVCDDQQVAHAAQPPPPPPALRVRVLAAHGLPVRLLDGEAGGGRGGVHVEGV
mmetsp:Transcript_89405/g.178688  ORF Transcript_89405/g.178688 Transcript_89405/m.178688 type:complete len:271 (+) Transcript_89405:589-1401(+)